MSGIGNVAPAPFDRILGEWLIERTIPGTAMIYGTADVVLLPSGDALYREQVTVTLESGKTLLGRCSYHHRRMEDGFVILFAETSAIFQTLQFRSQGGDLIAKAQHTCALDLYSSEYVLRANGGFAVRHCVRGPRKNYVIATELRRA